MRREAPYVITATTPDGKKKKKGFWNLEDSIEWQMEFPPGTKIWIMMTWANMGWGSTVRENGMIY